jgi:hypothetical protein
MVSTSGSSGTLAGLHASGRVGNASFGAVGRHRLGLIGLIGLIGGWTRGAGEICPRHPGGGLLCLLL